MERCNDVFAVVTLATYVLGSAREQINSLLLVGMSAGSAAWDSTWDWPRGTNHHKLFLTGYLLPISGTNAGAQTRSRNRGQGGVGQAIDQ